MGSYSRKRYATESASFPKSASSAPGSYSYENFADLPATGSTPGNTAFVVATNKLYIWSGVGWYLIATVTNVSPTAITGVSDTYALAIDGTATTITAVSTDPEGFALTWSYAVSSGSLGSTATVAQADNVFTITPSSTEADAGTFSLTFSVTDGLNGVVSAVSAFTLSFSVTNSRYTALSVKATAAGSNQTFDDASTSNHTITVAGNSTASTFSPYRHGGYSAYFQGPGAYLVPASTAMVIPSSTEFTIECWAYLTAKNTHQILFGGSSGYLYFSVKDDNTVEFQIANSTAYFPWAGTLNNNTWYYIAVVRNSTNTIKLWIDGVEVTATSGANQTGALTIANIGKAVGYVSSSDFNGYISDFKVDVGNARYSSNFTPPTSPSVADSNTTFLLGRLPYFKDQSTSNHAITPNGNVSLEPKSVFDPAAYSESSHGASAYFDGTGDYISVANHADFNFGSGNFTIESYVYYTINPTTNQAIVAQWHTATDRRAWQLRRDNSGQFRFFWSTTGADYPYIQSTGINLNTMNRQWIHVAVVRNGNTITMYVDGTDVVNTTLTGSLYDNTADDIFIGARSTNPPNIDHQTEGYIQDLRITKGTAVYTSNFTPPTAPLTAITNTKFLLNPETSISDLSQQHALTCYGNVATDATTVKFAGTKSIAFNGTGDYIVFSNGTPSTTDLTFDEEFTIEFWAYLNATNVTTIFYSCGGGTANWSATTGNESSFFIYNGKLYHQSSQGGSFHSDNISIPSVVQTGQWQHWAITCDANADCKWYLNGTLMWSYAHVFPTKKTGTIWRAVIGAGQYLTDDNLDGYIQDFRITKGLVRYTSNFTPPTELQG